ncbi:TetR family transcriptional regulator [Rhodococcus sp. 14C212]|uniref:acyl-CoA-like ligand-binding transcription factor n=1 Tax=Rhodococcus sp. 14C212 TaxID=2711209 RepID=UPI0013EA337D|nr:TetR family transcriptional regulator [Rhodococcus sp. 14C212]NGP09025.1 TetR family transcriptional regulator [Rhodococcus sp. 14C212]
MTTSRRGRPPASSRARVEAAAFDLFLDRGYAATGLADIAAAAGISKTTFFRYYPTKGALIWAAFEEHTRYLQRVLARAPEDVPVMEVVRAGVVEAVAAGIDEEGVWSKRFRILEASDELQAEGAQRWLTWAEVVATFVAGRIGDRPAAVVPASIGGAVQAAVLAVVREWMRRPASRGELPAELGAALAPLCRSLQGWLEEL